jgi:hypothetical protein
MKRSLLFLCLIGLLLAACGQAPPAPTSLPTAVPPDAIPEEDAGLWAVGFQYDFPAETFGLGDHRYRFLIHCPVVLEDTNTDWQFFQISDEVPLQPEPIYLRLQGLSSESFSPAYITNTTFHPDRPVIAVVYLVGLARPAAELASADCEVIVFWDAVGRHALAAGEPFTP